MALNSEVREKIETVIASDPVVLFMKGRPESPQCGFSARIVGILDVMLEDYVAVDVLANDDIREGIKEYANWPTIPQLYINGDFAGGCDIVQEMLEAGSLAGFLGVNVPEPHEAQVTITAAAAQAIREATPDTDREAVRLAVTSKKSCTLSLGAKQHGDVYIRSEGVMLALDPFSAQRADGVLIDHVRRGFNNGFVITRADKGSGQRRPAANHD